MNAKCSVHAIPSCDVIGWTVYQGSADVVLGGVFPLERIRLRSPEMVRHCECPEPVPVAVRITPDFGGGWLSAMCPKCSAILGPWGNEADIVDVSDSLAERCTAIQRTIQQA